MRTPLRSPVAPAFAAATTSGTTASTDVESLASWPAMTSCNRAVTVASYGEVQPSRIFDPQVVGISVVVNTSLSANGTPARGDGSDSPAATALSTAAAEASALSPATCRNAWYFSSVWAI